MNRKPKIYAQGFENIIYKPPFECINEEGNNPAFELSRMSRYEYYNQQDFIDANEIMDEIDPTFIFHAKWAPCKINDTDNDVKIVNMENSGTSLNNVLRYPPSDFYIMLILFELLRPLIDIVNCYNKGYQRADDLNDGNIVFDFAKVKMVFIDQKTKPLSTTPENKQLIISHCRQVINKALPLIELLQMPEKDVFMMKLLEINNLLESPTHEPIDFVKNYLNFIEYCYKEYYPKIHESSDKALLFYTTKTELTLLAKRLFPELEDKPIIFDLSRKRKNGGKRKTRNRRKTRKSKFI